MHDLFLSIMMIIILLLMIIMVVLWRRAKARTPKTEWGKSWLNFLDILNKLFCQYYHRLKYIPIALPAEGPALIVANHVSGLDPMLLIAASQRPIRFMIARNQYDRFGRTWLFKGIGCIPVERSTHPDKALRVALRALQNGEVIALFPQGTFTLPHERRKIKRGGLWLAQQVNCPIYPVFISGISGMGSVIRGIFTRSHATLENYSLWYGHDDNIKASLQALVDGQLKNDRPE